MHRSVSSRKMVSLIGGVSMGIERMVESNGDPLEPLTCTSWIATSQWDLI